MNQWYLIYVSRNETASSNSLSITIDDGGILPHPVRETMKIINFLELIFLFCFVFFLQPSRLLLHWCPGIIILIEKPALFVRDTVIIDM